MSVPQFSKVEFYFFLVYKALRTDLLRIRKIIRENDNLTVSPSPYFYNELQTWGFQSKHSYST